MFEGKKKKTAHPPKNTVPTVKHGGGSIVVQGASFQLGIEWDLELPMSLFILAQNLQTAKGKEELYLLARNRPKAHVQANKAIHIYGIREPVEICWLRNHTEGLFITSRGV